jgi:hypothetical protein
MCILQIHVQCFGRFFEVLLDEVKNAELAVEEFVSHVLVNLFGEGTVDDVTICSSGLIMGQQHCSIQIYAQCPYQSFAQQPLTKENVELAVKKSIGSILKELFGPVNVDSVTFSPSPWDGENDSTRSRKRFYSPS